MTNQKNIRGKNIVMVNSAVIFRREEVAEYIRKRCDNFALISFVMPYMKGISSDCRFYHQGKLQKKFRLLSFKRPFILVGPLLFLDYLIYCLSILYALSRLRKKFDIYLGMDYFYTFMGLILKKMGLCKKVVYCSGDYFPSEKGNCKREIFQFLDKINVRFVDAVWNDTEAMIEARRKEGALVRKNIPNFVSPQGLCLREECLRKNLSNTNEIIFFGRVQAGRGFELLLDIFPNLIKKVPDIKLHVVGTGSHVEIFREQFSKRGLDDCVFFHGFVESPQVLDEIFSKCVLGLALFVPTKFTFTYYSTPGKIMEYLSRGLPVITNDVPPIAKRIQEYGAGAVIDYSSSALEGTILKMLKDRQFLERSAAGAKSLALEYKWDKVLDSAFEKISAGWQK